VVLDERANKARLIAASGVSKTVLASNQQFAAALEALGVAVPTKISKTTGKVAYALAKNDQDFAALLGHSDSRVNALVEARLAIKSTIDETRAERLLKVAELTGGWLPVPLNYCGASQTARLAGSEKLNLQNLGRNSGIRHAVEAPEGFVVLAADLSNIELRVNLTAAGQADAVNKLRSGEDLYCDFASVLYGRPISKADKTERTVGKVAQLSLGYGSGADTFKQMLWVMGGGMVVSRDEAKRIVDTYRTAHPFVPNMWASLKGWAYQATYGGVAYVPTYHAPVTFDNGGVTLPSGFKIKYPNLRAEKRVGKDGNTENSLGYTRYGGKAGSDGFSYAWHGVFAENCGQGLAAEVLWDMIVRIHQRYGVWPALQVHDEIVFVIPESRADEVKAGILEIMHQSPLWWTNLPVAAEAAYGKSYGDAK